MSLLAITGPDLAEAIPVILSLIVIEGLLSVDNALAIAAMASHLPGKQKLLALRLGIIGAYVFRGVALAFATVIIEHAWLKFVGAAYLIHLMCTHFAERHPKLEVIEQSDEPSDPPAPAPSQAESNSETGPTEQAFDSEDRKADGDSELTHLAEKRPAAAAMAGKGLVATIASIELMDLSLSVDNVVVAVAMSPKLWVVCTGVFIGILALRLVAGYCIKLIERYPILEHTAFLLIGYVGALLVAKQLSGGRFDPHTMGKFIGIVIILALSVYYSRNINFAKAMRPFIAGSNVIMRGYAALSNAILGAIAYPFKAAFRLFRPVRPVPDEAG